MRVISEERLNELKDNDCYTGIEKSVICELISDECQELNPWIPLEEFLKSGFEGPCWVFLKDSTVVFANFYISLQGLKIFSGNNGTIWIKSITHVQPIHKPEPPR